MSKKISARKAFSHPSKAYLVTIVALMTRISQSWRYRKLVRAIRRRELTQSLEILEASGIKDEIAQLFIICNCNLQALEDAR